MSDSSQQSDLKTCYYRVKRTSHRLRKSNSTIGEGNGTPLQYCCLENPMDGGAWKAEVHGVAEGQTQLSDFFHFSLSCVGEGNGNPLQCACLENLRHGGAWWAAIYGVAQSWTRLKGLSSSSCFTDYAKTFDCVYYNKLWKILKEMGTPDHLTCLLRNLYAGQEATVRTRHGTTDRFHIGKGLRQGCILLPWLFNLYTEYIM